LKNHGRLDELFGISPGKRTKQLFGLNGQGESQLEISQKAGDEGGR
jgi:hypothetical protein